MYIFILKREKIVFSSYLITRMSRLLLIIQKKSLYLILEVI